MAIQSGPVLKLDANNQYIQDSYNERAFRGEYSGTNLIYRGYARPGADTSNTIWQIAKLTYDGSNNVTAIQWPKNSLGVPTSEYTYKWDDRATYTYV